VYSEVSTGTTFNIYLPLIKADVHEIAPVEQEKAIGGSETILIAADDELLRDLLASVLREYKYDVIEAKDGEEAVRKYKENRDRIALVILDVVMPKMNGQAAGSEIMKIHPEAKILFQSGYPMDIMSQRGQLDDMNHLLRKPCSPHEILKKVRELIDA